MTTKLSELLNLEKIGRYDDALEMVSAYKKMGSETSPISSTNLDIVEQRLRRRSKGNLQSRNLQDEPSTESSASEQHASWSAIITMWKRIDYLSEQLTAIRNQSIPAAEIIIIINERHINEDLVRGIAGDDVRIIFSDVNSLYSRWALAYIAKGEYVSIFDDDVIPGDLWVANAMRVCETYRALVGPSGRIYSKDGKYEYYKLVTPHTQWKDEQTISCEETDVYCDWVCNSYFFKREWVGYALSAPRYKDSFKTFDDIQLATSLHLYGGIRCVTPMQPRGDRRLHGSLQHQYGNDSHAIWKTNSDYHFSSRKSYIELLIDQGYQPVQTRDGVYRMHLIVPFGDRQYLERCLLSIKGQVYNNFTCTLIDDCHDGGDSLALLEHLQLDNSVFRYIKTTKKSYPLRSRELATDLLQANPADIVIHLDGDDWLPYPDVLSRLDKIYRSKNPLVTYGNTIAHCVGEGGFSEFKPYEMSKRWNVEQSETNAEIFPFREVSKEELRSGWEAAPWCAMHMRTFQYIKWVALDRSTFKNKDGDYLRVATDAAIFLPILKNTEANSVCFVPELSYTYQNGRNTIHAKKEISSENKITSLNCVKEGLKPADMAAVKDFLIGIKASRKFGDAEIVYGEKFGAQSLGSSRAACSKKVPTAIVTVITPDYLADGILCLTSYQENLQDDCTPFVFLASEDGAEIAACTAILEKLDIKAIYPGALKFTEECSVALKNKYAIKSDEYRWAMKSVSLLELLRSGFHMALFLDPDTYTVSNITDVHRSLMKRPVSVFPHFRDPDNEYLRKVLYKDGFFNGGMLAANHEGKKHLTRLYERCLQEMVKAPERSRWDDQKYFDLFALEATNLFVNQDRGINYNPWNYEPVEGLLSPSQRSYMLKTGFFVRHWHVSTMMIKNSIELKEKKFSIYRPLVVIYLLSLLYTIVLITATAKRDKQKESRLVLGQTTRFEAIAEKLLQISNDIPVPEIRNLRAMAEANGDASEAVQELFLNSLRASIIFDNFAIFSRLYRALFTGPNVSKNVDTLRARDLRYIADEITASASRSHASVPMNTDAGTIIKERLKALQSQRIDY